MAQVHCRNGDGEIIELTPDAEIFIRFPGVPGRHLTVAQLVSAVGDERLYYALMERDGGHPAFQS